jgi:cell division protein FtsW (lipid II flippase)
MTSLRSGLVGWRRWAGHTLEERDRPRDRREATLLAVAALFVVANVVALGLATAGGWAWPRLLWPAVWLVVSVLAHVALRHLKPHRDPLLLPVYVLLAGWGLLLQDRLAPNFLGRQTLWYVVATAALLIVAAAPRSLKPLMRYRYVLLLGGLLLVAITLVFGVNPGGSGVALWLPIPAPVLGVVYFQPSELLKVLLVIFLASYFTEQEPLYRYSRHTARRDDVDGRPNVVRRLLRQLPFLGPLLLMWGFCLLLLVWQQDLGAAALFFIVFVALLYLATGERVYVFSGLALLAAAAVFAFFVFDTVVAPRVLTWLNPWPNVSDRAYQVVQSLYAQAAGGVFGRGAGQGFPDYIPVVHSDFALAAIAEEWGLVGSLTVVAAFAVIALRGLRAALLALQGFRPRYFHAYLAAGLVVLFSVQAVLIIGGVIKLLPLTGITLPFISYGGSSLLVSSVMLGLLIHLSAAGDPALPTRAFDPRLARRLDRLGVALLAAFAVVALTLAYWSAARSDALAARPDNPRLVEAERRLRRGRIVDRHGAVLAESVGATGALARVYPQAGGPAVGYYSVRFGAAGIERAYDTALRGQSDDLGSELWQAMTHASTPGRDVRLTLDAGLQATATAQMAGYSGGLVLLELSTVGGAPEAAIRALVSQPTYDPNDLAEQFEALATDARGPLLDRASQGLYQPGLIVQPFLTAAAVESGVIQLDDVVAEPFAPVTLDGRVQRCVVRDDQPNPAARHTWADMAHLRCPAPLQALGAEMGAVAIGDVFARFGLTTPPALPVPTTGQGALIDRPELAAIGQAGLTVTPLQAALATAALAGDGRLPAPRLVEAVTDANGAWVGQPSAIATTTAVDAGTAAAILATWPLAGDIAEFAVSPLSGPAGHHNTWYLGLAPAGAPRFVVALVLEDANDIAAAEAIGRAVLAEASE